jgi:amylosucrase
MHRPPMDWAAAARRHDRAGVEGRLFAGLQAMAATRASLLSLRAGTMTQLVDTDSSHVLAYARRHPRGTTFLGLANFSDAPSEVGPDRLASVLPGDHDLRLASDGVRRTGPGIWLPAWGWAWLADH